MPRQGDNRVNALVAEAAYANLSVAVEHRLTMLGGPLSKRLVHRCVNLANDSPDLGFEIQAFNPVDEIGKLSPRPVLLITDCVDFTCPRSQSDLLYSAAREPKSRWVAHGAPHVQASRVYPTEYKQRILDFLNITPRLD